MTSAAPFSAVALCDLSAKVESEAVCLSPSLHMTGTMKGWQRKKREREGERERERQTGGQMERQTGLDSF